MDQILEQVEGAVGIADDVAVYSKTTEEHDEILHNLFKVAAENGLVFNSITFFGMKYDANGVHPDPEKVVSLVRFSSERISRIRAATKDDAILRQLTNTIVWGWPETLQGLTPAIRSY